MQIHKYRVEPVDKAKITMPRGAVLLSVAEQYGEIVVWAWVDPDVPMVTRNLYVVGTGSPADHIADLPFVGTVVMMSGTLVLHIFDGGEE